MKKYIVKMRLRVNGDVHKAGDTVELSDNQATPLLNMKAVTLAPVAEPITPIKTVTPATEPTIESATPKTEPTTETATPANAPVATPNPTVEPSPSATPVAPIERAEPVATPTEAQTSSVNAYSNFTKAQLNAELDKRGIAHDSKATNEVLESLLVADDNKAQ